MQALAIELSFKMPIDEEPYDWPSNAIARASEATNSILRRPGEHSRRHLIIELPGDSVRRAYDITLLLSKRLSLPELTNTDPSVAARAVENRLDVMANAERYVTLVLTRADALKRSALEYILELFEHSPLRLLLLSAAEDSRDTEEHIHALGLALIDLDPRPSTTAVEVNAALPKKPQSAQTPARNAEPAPNEQTTRLPAHLWSYAVGVVALSAVAGWWFWSAEQEPRTMAITPAPTTTQPTATQPYSTVADKQEQRSHQDEQSTELEAASEKTELKIAPLKQVAVAAASPAANLPRYTIQVASYSSMTTLQAFLSTLENQPKQLRSLPMGTGSVQKRRLIYGEYMGYSAAAQALESLPAELNQGAPFVVRLSSIEK